MFDQCAEKTNVIDASAMGLRNQVVATLVPRLADPLRVDHEEPIAVGQLVEPTLR
jgi:hypothetical protein